jgi:SAM-dependent methyltransferase
VVSPTLHCPCDRRFDERAFTYDAPPAGETRFDLRGQVYRRAYARCTVCGHWYSEHALDLGALYGGAYVESTYGDQMRQTFERILALPPEKSDNAGRVARILEFAAARFPAGKRPALLDVGSGLAVFPAKMKEAGWQCTALDPDPRAASHAYEVAGVAAVTGDFMSIDAGSLGRYDVVTFNKVLEHVEDPVGMLAKSAGLVADGGFVYLEVPDGEAAAVEGPGREEYFIEHHHVFGPVSLAMMAGRAGFSLSVMERLREPSTKFTLRAFLTREAR